MTTALGLMAAQSGASRRLGIHYQLQRAAEYLKANDAKTAAKEFAAVLAVDPKHAEANANLGVIAFLQGDCKRAAPYLRNALATRPSLVKTQALLGMCEMKLGQPSGQALLEKSFPRLKDKALHIRVGMELAGVFYRQGNLDRAASVMRSLVNLDPDNLDVLFIAQRIYSDLADDTLNKLAILAPGSAQMERLIAEHLINEGDLKSAVEHYRKALAINPHLPGLYFELAEATLESAPNDAQVQAEAEKQLEASVQLEGDSARTECLFGRNAARRSDGDSAYAHYSRAFALNPEDPEAQIGLGRLLVTRGKPQEALKYFRMAVESGPLNEHAHYRLATSCRSLQLKDKSAKEFRLFQEIKQARDNLRELYRQMNKKPPGHEDEVSDAEK